MLQKGLPPPLLVPRQFRHSLEADKEFALEVEKLVEIREKEVYGILVNEITLR